MSTTESTKAGQRTAELEMTINAPVEDVFKAISQAEELVKWFPLDAKGGAGEGAKIWMAWGDSFEGTCDIEVWEPPTRLRTTFMDHDEAGAEMRTWVEYFLESEGGATRLRLVHSGFGEGAHWDKLYDAVSRGWQGELNSLKHYLERHAGRDRRVCWTRAPIASTRDEAWRRVVGSQGLGVRDFASLKPGDRFTASSPLLGDLSGDVLAIDQRGLFTVRLDQFENAFLRVEIDDCGGPGLGVWFWLATWNAPEERVSELQRRIPEEVGALVG